VQALLKDIPLATTVGRLARRDEAASGFMTCATQLLLDGVHPKITQERLVYGPISTRALI
jgi:hypothetical protein